MNEELGYLHLLSKLRRYGNPVSDRTGVGTRSLFGEQLRFDLSQGFPLLTTKKLHFKSILVELLWMLKGKTNVDYLHKQGVTIWDEWADQAGELGPVYGKQWREFGEREHDGFVLPGVDQMRDLIHGLKTNPHGRRHVVSAWNPVDIPQMKLPPCHCLFQMYVKKQAGNNYQLSTHLYQRSADIFLGVPYNIASYALLTQIIAQECGYNVGELIISFGDVHLYNNHQEQAATQLSRGLFPLPWVEIIRGGAETIFDLEPECFVLHDYRSHPAIKAPVAV